MLTKEDNELVTNVRPGTPMGELFRRFWLPVALVRGAARPGLRAAARQGPGRGPHRLPRHRRPASAWSTPTAPTAARRCSSAATRRTACAASTTAGSSTSTASASTCRTRPKATPSRQDPHQVATPASRQGRPDLGLHGAEGEEAAVPGVRVDEAAAEPPLRDASSVAQCNYLQAMEGDYDPCTAASCTARWTTAPQPAAASSDVAAALTQPRSRTLDGRSPTTSPSRAPSATAASRRTTARASDAARGHRAGACSSISAPSAPDGKVAGQRRRHAGGCRSSAPPASRGPDHFSSNMRIPIDNESLMFYRLRWSCEPDHRGRARRVQARRLHPPGADPRHLEPKANVQNDYDDRPRGAEELHLLGHQDVPAAGHRHDGEPVGPDRRPRAGAPRRAPTT